MTNHNYDDLYLTLKQNMSLVGAPTRDIDNTVQSLLSEAQEKGGLSQRDLEESYRLGVEGPNGYDHLDSDQRIEVYGNRVEEVEGEVIHTLDPGLMEETGSRTLESPPDSVERRSERDRQKL